MMRKLRPARKNDEATFNVVIRCLQEVVGGRDHRLAEPVPAAESVLQGQAVREALEGVLAIGGAVAGAAMTGGEAAVGSVATGEVVAGVGVVVLPPGEVDLREHRIRSRSAREYIGVTAAVYIRANILQAAGIQSHRLGQG